jgi:hypothetical protein
MWIWISNLAPPLRNLYIGVCYFPPASSHFSIHSDSVGDPYQDLHVGITQYSTVGKVIHLDDFNAYTRALQIPLHDHSDDVFCIQEIDPKSVPLH